MHSITLGTDAGVAADGVAVWFVDAHGVERCERLVSCGAVAFEDVRPARGFPSYRGQRYFPGLWWAATNGRHVGYESWLERDHAMALDFDRNVAGLSSQPFTLSWLDEGRRVSHTPDYFARLGDGTALVVDVRPAGRVKPKDAVKFQVTAEACAAVGCWSFRLVHELEPVLVSNLRWLSGYRHPRHGHPALSQALREVFTGRTGLLAGAAAAGDPIASLPVLFHLLWRGELVTDLSVPMHDPDVDRHRRRGSAPPPAPIPSRG
jgi:hypothetical protein